MSSNRNAHTACARRLSGWSALTRNLVEWHRRVRARNELRNLGDNVLHDMGLSRCDVEDEVSKPFWKP